MEKDLWMLTLLINRSRFNTKALPEKLEYNLTPRLKPLNINILIGVSYRILQKDVERHTILTLQHMQK
jgi:hypothetical protein